MPPAVTKDQEPSLLSPEAESRATALFAASLARSLANQQLSTVLLFTLVTADHERYAQETLTGVKQKAFDLTGEETRTGQALAEAQQSVPRILLFAPAQELVKKRDELNQKITLLTEMKDGLSQRLSALGTTATSLGHDVEKDKALQLMFTEAESRNLAVPIHPPLRTLLEAGIRAVLSPSVEVQPKPITDFLQTSREIIATVHSRTILPNPDAPVSRVEVSLKKNKKTKLSEAPEHLDVTGILEEAGIPLEGLPLPQHLAKSLRTFVVRGLKDVPTKTNMRTALQLILDGDVQIADVADRPPLLKLLLAINNRQTPEGDKPAPKSLNDSLLSKGDIVSPPTSLSPKVEFQNQEALAGALSFDPHGRWKAEIPGGLAAKVFGGPLRHTDTSKIAVKRREKQKEEAMGRLGDEVDALIAAASAAKIKTVGSLLASDRIQLQKFVRDFLEGMPKESPVASIQKLPSAISMPRTSSHKPRDRKALIDFLTEEKK